MKTAKLNKMEAMQIRGLYFHADCPHCESTNLIAVDEIEEVSIDHFRTLYYMAGLCTNCDGEVQGLDEKNLPPEVVFPEEKVWYSTSICEHGKPGYGHRMYRLDRYETICTNPGCSYRI